MPGDKIFSRCHASLYTTLLLFLPPLLLPFALGYATTQFQKTKISSHLNFLRQCRKYQVIPKGFSLFHSPSDLSNSTLKTTTENILHQASHKLMQAHIQSLTSSLEPLSELLKHFHQRTTLIMPTHTASKLKYTIHTHNQLIYSHCSKIKEVKLIKLLTIHNTKHTLASNHCNINPNNDTTQNQYNLVQCIPDTLTLTESERSVLSKGLKYIPRKPSANRYQNLIDCERFFRKLRWMAVLDAVPRPPPFLPDSSDVFTHLFQTPSYNQPPSNKSADVELYIAKCRKEISQIHTKPIRHSNLTKEEQKAVQSLQKRQDIVIKPADKGGAIVVWDRDLYLAEANKQLSNTTAYKPLTSPSLPKDQKHIGSIIRKEIRQYNLPPTAKRLIMTNTKQPTLYLLPKIHKKDTPGRPIVSACSCPTEHISQYIDFLLQPIVQSLPTYLKDTTHTLNLINTFNLDPSFTPKLLFTLDVVSLYTSIPHADGLKALTFFLNKRPANQQHPPTDTLTRLAELVLTLNTFEFNGHIFSQISGVAMGTKMGPAYACLFMGHLEHLIQTSYKGPTPELYKRYIDDGLGATSLSKQHLLDFISFVQNFHPSIKFTHNISQSVNFLDISISLHNGQFTTSIFYKPTDSHAYLNYTSSHHTSTKNSIPYSEFLRLRRLCSDEEDFDIQADNMSSFFSDRGYPQAVIITALHKARLVPRHTTLQSKPPQSTDRPTVNLLFHPHTLPICKILRTNWHLLTNNKTTSSTFHNKPLITFRRDRNLRDLLVKSSLLTNTTPTTLGTSPCSNTNCKTCPFVIQNTTLQGPKASHKVTGTFTCQSRNIIYAILCSQCHKIYVGETSRSLNIRITEHLADIRHNRPKPVASHFCSPNHNIQHVQVMALWQVKGDTFERTTQEMHLIAKLGTSAPLGINIQT